MYSINNSVARVEAVFPGQHVPPTTFLFREDITIFSPSLGVGNLLFILRWKGATNLGSPAGCKRTSFGCKRTSFATENLCYMIVTDNCRLFICAWCPNKCSHTPFWQFFVGAYENCLQLFMKCSAGILYCVFKNRSLKTMLSMIYIKRVWEKTSLIIIIPFDVIFGCCSTFAIVFFSSNYLIFIFSSFLKHYLLIYVLHYSI